MVFALDICPLNPVTNPKSVIPSPKTQAPSPKSQVPSSESDVVTVSVWPGGVWWPPVVKPISAAPAPLSAPQLSLQCGGKDWWLFSKTALVHWLDVNPDFDLQTLEPGSQNLGPIFSRTLYSDDYKGRREKILQLYFYSSEARLAIGNLKSLETCSMKMSGMI